MRTTIGLFVLAFSLISNAKIELPVSQDVFQNGYENYPIVTCPSANEFSETLLTKLQNLKAAIKKEANCEGLELEVGELSDLVTSKKENFLDLVNKGVQEGLSDNESDQVKSYVSKLTTTTSNLFQVLAGEDACFDEDKKINSLSFLSSLVSEGSKLLGILDPTGRTIQIAGNVIAGFMQGMDQLKEVGYDFDKHKDRVAFNESLCALYEHKKEFDQYLYADEQIRRLLELDFLLETNKRRMTRSCSGCGSLENKITNLYQRQNGNQHIRQWTSQEENAINEATSLVNLSEENSTGSHVLQFQKAQQWVSYRIETLNNSHFQADLNMQEALDELSEIQEFMLESEAPDFLNYEIRLAKNKRTALINKIMREAPEYILAGVRDEVTSFEHNLFSPRVPGSTDFKPDTVANIFPILQKLEIIARAYRNQPRKRSRLATFRAEIRQSIKEFEAAAQNAVRYCHFFLYSQHWYPREIARVCEQTRGTSWLMSELEALEQGQQQSLAAFHTGLVTRKLTFQGSAFIEQQKKVHTLDWIESMSFHLSDALESSQSAGQTLR